VVAGHLPGGAAPDFYCEDGKSILNTRLTGIGKAGQPCPIDAVVLLGGYQSQDISTQSGMAATAGSAPICGPLVGGHDSGQYPTEQCPLDGKPLLDQHITDITLAGKPCPVQFCGAVITGGRLRQH